MLRLTFQILPDLTFQNVVDWVAVLPGRGEDGKDILSDFELLIWGFARNEDF